ncbi:MAG TPA: tetratricopeptide repeat protein [Candidatus Binataceae bacterium]|nr:tetratricopeptide repeat protein [Candidatus Binataceae bacterium]
MRFCPQCGAPLMAGAKFCVECGRPLNSPAAPAGPLSGNSTRGSGARALGQSLRNMPITASFVGVFLGITILGLVLAVWISRSTPTMNVDASSTSPGSVPGSNVPPAPNPMAGTAGNNAPGELPQGHPKIELPTEARTFIDQTEKDAKAKPDDLEAWNKFGTVAMRAALFDPIYYAKAQDAYAHVLKLDPDNPTALRGVGDIDYDQNQYDQAVAAYEHYLKLRPDDPEVRTDLGTMYLYTGNPDQAIVQYKKALKAKPDFFQAYYNMGVAYAQAGQTPQALESLNHAMKLAPDDAARNQVNQLIAKVNGSGSETASAGAGAGNSAGATAPPATTFHGEVEQNVRALPFAGPKVSAVQWPTDLRATVLMDHFPMDQMPPFAKQKFLGDLKAGIDSAKKDYKISGTVQLDITDSASGRVMETVTD